MLPQALVPVLRQFPAVRDIALLLVRKALFNRDAVARSVGLQGCLVLLHHIASVR